MHWFHLPTFYSEAHRILKPGGVLASWGYATPVLGSPALDGPLTALYEGTLGPYWAPNRRLVDARYVGMEPTNFVEVKRWESDLVKTMTVRDFMGYLSTWSAYQDWKRANPEAPDSIQGLCETMLETDSAMTLESTLEVRWPLFAILARK